MNDAPEIKKVGVAAVTRALRQNGFPKATGHQAWNDDGSLAYASYYLDNEYEADRYEAKLLELGFVVERKRWFCNVTNREARASVLSVSGRTVKAKERQA